MPERHHPRKQAATRRSRGQRRARAAIAPQPTTAPATTAGRPMPSAPTPREATPDYSHVPRDLKRIFILTGGLVAVLIILFFIWK